MTSKAERIFRVGAGHKQSEACRVGTVAGAAIHDAASGTHGAKGASPVVVLTGQGRRCQWPDVRQWHRRI